jgi:pyruvate formate lyase activating enzyme
MDMQATHKALWWEPLDEAQVICKLCPRHCRIDKGTYGFCGVRKNIDGELYSLSYGYPVALQSDPIEKKPLLEFMPGTRVFSLGTFGCNLGCVFCQNYQLSRGHYDEARQYDYFSPARIVELALMHGCKSVACTYNEPTVFAEYAIDIAREAAKNKLAFVLVSNAYITLEAAADLFPHTDAANFDMKGFSESFYTEMTRSRLQPVLDAIKYFYSLGKHLELTNLVIPGKNDEDDMINAYLDWVEQELDPTVPLHFSAYHPACQCNIPPTAVATLHHIKDLTQKRGFSHVYLGNI